MGEGRERMREWEEGGEIGGGNRMEGSVGKATNI